MTEELIIEDKFSGEEDDDENIDNGKNDDGEENEDGENDDGYQSRLSPQNCQNESNSDKVSPQKNWMEEFKMDEIKLLAPDDPLMKRFQDAYHAHLLRVDEKLTQELRELKAVAKETEKALEEERLKLYNAQQVQAREEAQLKNLKEELAQIANENDDLDEKSKIIKEKHKKVCEDLESKVVKEKELRQTVKSLDKLYHLFSTWEEEVAGDLKISKRMSEKDAATQRDLLRQKRERDYLLYKVEDDIWKLENEIKDLEEQAKIKEEDKTALGQMVADANADLECLEKEQKVLYNAWKSLLNLINQRHKVYEGIIAEQRKIREDIRDVEIKIANAKKDAVKEKENHERLTVLQSRLSEELKIVEKQIEAEKEKYSKLESEFMKITKLIEQNEKELNGLTAEYNSIVNEEKSLDKEIAKLEKKNRELEEKILKILDEKANENKEVQRLTKQIREIEESYRENELKLTKINNTCAKHLQEVEEMKSRIQKQESDIEAAKQRNLDIDNEISKLEKEIKHMESLYKQKENKESMLKKKIDEITEARGGETAHPLDVQIKDAERDIAEKDEEIRKLQQLCMRARNSMFTLCEKRDSQLQEISILNKEILVLEQNRRKVEVDFENAKKEESDIDKSINKLRHKLTQQNLQLAAQRNKKNLLEGENCAIQKECIQQLKDDELRLIRLQGEIKQLNDERESQKEELKQLQQEIISWEKKIQLAKEENDLHKKENSAGGEMAEMKSDIRRMKTQLSKYKKTQEKYAREMELSIMRRENVIDKVLARQKRDPKIRRNQEITLKKRLDYKIAKLKEEEKELKQLDTQIEKLEKEQKELTEYLDEGQKSLRQKQDIIADLSKQIAELELIKDHNQEVLVRKKRRYRLFQDAKKGKYKPKYKDEETLNAEWEKAKKLNGDLTKIMLQTEQAFPLLKNEIRRILLTLEPS